MLAWCSHRQLPCHILLTKADKLKRGPAINQLQQVKKTLSTDPELQSLEAGLVSIQLFSAMTRQGLEEAHRVLDGWLVSSDTPAADDDEPPHPGSG